MARYNPKDDVYVPCNDPAQPGMYKRVSKYDWEAQQQAEADRYVDANRDPDARVMSPMERIRKRDQARFAEEDKRWL